MKGLSVLSFFVGIEIGAFAIAIAYPRPTTHIELSCYAPDGVRQAYIDNGVLTGDGPLGPKQGEGTKVTVMHESDHRLETLNGNYFCTIGKDVTR